MPPPRSPEKADKAFCYSGPGFCGVCDTRVYSALDPGRPHDSMPSGAGSVVALPCHMVCVMEGVGRACLENLAEKHGGSTLDITTNVAKFPPPPWTVTRDIWHAALRLDVSGVAMDALLFHEAGRQLVHRYRVYKDPFPHPALRDAVIPRLLSCVCRAMAIARLSHLRISIPSSGAAPDQVPAECFPGETAPVPQSHLCRMSFADKVTMLGEEDSPECSQLVSPLILPVVVEEIILVSEAGVPSLILPVVEELNNDTPAAELIEMEPSTTESGLPPLPYSLHLSGRKTMGGWTLMTCVCGSVGIVH